MIYLWELLKALPSIVGFVVQVKKWVDRENDIQLRKDALKKVTDAIKKSNEERTTNAIESLFVSPGSNKSDHD